MVIIYIIYDNHIIEKSSFSMVGNLRLFAEALFSLYESGSQECDAL